jgi:hypothetical protein
MLRNNRRYRRSDHMPDTRDSLDFLERTALVPEARPTTTGEEDDLGPCASRATTKWWPGFHVTRAKLISKKGPSTLTTRSFDYSHMGYREFDPGDM